MYTVYIDEVFIRNWVMDLAVLLLAGRLFSCRTTWRRLAAGAAAGGAWACAAAVLPGMWPVLRLVGTYGITGSLMAVIAFGGGRRLLAGERAAFCALGREILGIYLVSMVLGGGMELLAGQRDLTRGSMWLLSAAGAFFGAWGLCGYVRRTIRTMAARKDLCQVTLRCGTREERAAGLIDTGNRLREPVSGQPVHVAGRELMCRLCPTVRGVVYVPYRSVGVGEGVLPAVRIDEMEIDQGGVRYVLQRPLVAVAKQPPSPSGEYEILIQKTD